MPGMAISADSNGSSKFSKQARYAASRALNDSAFAARSALVTQLGRSFTIRNKYTERGFRIVKASRDKLEAVVGTSREYLVDQVEGGTRRRKAIPSRHLRKTPTQIVRRSRWPKQLLAQASTPQKGGKRYLILPEGSNKRGSLPSFLRRITKGNRRAVLQRVGKGKNERLRLLWSLPKTTRVRARYPFEETAQNAHKVTFPVSFPVRLREALATTK
jgi:hypothetical protein